MSHPHAMPSFLAPYDDIKKVEVYEVGELEKIKHGRETEIQKEKVARFTLLGDHLSRVLALRTEATYSEAEARVQKKSEQAAAKKNQNHS